MAFFPATVEAHLQGREVGAALLCHMDFRETPRRWWGGFGPLAAGDEEWQGTGALIQIDGLEQPIGTTAPKTTFTLAGVDAEIVRLARQASDRVKDRRCTVYVQFFDISPDDASVMPWATLDAPFAIWSGQMDQLVYGAQGPSVRSLTLTAESLWVNRRRAPYGLYTDRDQNYRYPGDRGLEQVSDLVSKVVRWPVF